MTSMQHIVQSLADELSTSLPPERTVELAKNFQVLSQDGLHPHAMLDDDQLECLTRLSNRALALLSNSSPLYQKAGLMVLSVLCAKSPSSVVLTECATWCYESLAIIKGQGKRIGEAETHAWLLVASVFDRLGDERFVPGARRDGASLAQRFISTIQNIVDIESDAWWAHARQPGFMSALASVLCAFPASCRQHLKYFESLVEKILFHEAIYFPLQVNVYLARSAAICLVRLAQVSGDTTSWVMAISRLLSRLHRLVGLLFKSFEIGRIAQYYNEKYLLATDGSENLDVESSFSALDAGGIQSISNQVQTLLYCLSVFMSEPCHAAIEIPTEGVLELTTRILGIAENDATQRRGKSLPLSLTMAYIESMERICTGVLYLAQVLLCVAGSRCLSHLNEFGRCFDRFLQFMRSSLNSKGTSFAANSISIRSALYNAVACLLAVGGMSTGRCLAASALECIRFELYASRDAIKEDSSSPLVKKQRIADASTRTCPFLKWSTNKLLQPLMCQSAALHLLKILCISSAGDLTPALRSTATNIAVHFTHAVTCAIETSAQVAGIPLIPLCELQIQSYQAALAAVLSLETRRSSASSLLVHLFRIGLQSQSEEVRRVSFHALQSYEVFIHPRCLSRCPLESKNIADTADIALHSPRPSFWTYCQEAQHWTANDTVGTAAISAELEAPMKDKNIDSHQEVEGNCKQSVDVSRNAIKTRKFQVTAEKQSGVSMSFHHLASDPISMDDQAGCRQQPVAEPDDRNSDYVSRKSPFPSELLKRSTAEELDDLGFTDSGVSLPEIDSGSSSMES